jgi:hypothetical protein
MKRVTLMAAACVAAVMLALGISVRAQDFNPQERTFLTFSNSVELPGMTLPAGTYTFRLADTPSRNVVQVLSQDEKQVHGQFLFVQAERPEVSGETVITFRETKEGSTPAVQYWYYPGEKIGKEFIYPKDQAMKIATRTGSTVLTEDGPVSANSTASSTNAEGQKTEWQRDQTTASPSQAAVQGSSGLSAQASSDGNTRDTQATALAVEPSAQNQPAQQAAAPAPERTVAQAEPASQPTAAPAAGASEPVPAPVGTSGVQNEQPRRATDTPAELPRTASPLALSGLLGLLSLAGATGLRIFRG